MEQRKNQQPENLDRLLLELLRSHQQRIIQEFNLLNKRFDRIVLSGGSPLGAKIKEKDFFTTEEVMEMLSISRRTLLSFRMEGKIGFIKMHNTIRFTREQIESYKRKSVVGSQ